MSSREIQEVNIELGDDMYRYFTEMSRLTWSNRPPECLDTSGLSFGSNAQINNAYFGANAVTFDLQGDGTGTKPEISERMNEHSGSAFDLFAMVVDDAAASGGEAIAMVNILDVRELNSDNEVIMNGMRQLGEGMVAAAEAAGVVVTSGEIAELGARIHGYGDFNYNWCGVAFVATNRERRLTGQELKAGHAIVGLAEVGFRSNGISDVRRVMRENYGEHWHEQTEQSLDDRPLGAVMQTPSIIYAGLTRTLHGGFDLAQEPAAEVSGFAHITGGGQPSKLGRMLARTNGLGVVIDDPIAPPHMMLHVQKLAGFDDRRAYGKWHMGPGMVVVSPEPEKVIAEAQTFGIEAKTIGYISDQPGIRIRNMGAVQDQEWLVF